MDSVLRTRASHRFILVFDDRCSMVRRLADIVRKWDRHQTYTLVPRKTASEPHRSLLEKLTYCGLLLIREDGESWSGPESIPIILSHLPFGKIAAVAYILPGTMWLTHSLYKLAQPRVEQISDQTRTAA